MKNKPFDPLAQILRYFGFMLPGISFAASLDFLLARFGLMMKVKTSNTGTCKPKDKIRN